MIKVNKAKCLICEDIIESRHRHDYVTCKCGNICVDGGRDYLRRGAREMDKFLELSECEDNHEED